MPRQGKVLVTILDDGRLNVQTDGQLSILEMLFGIELAKTNLIEKARDAGGHGQLIPGMLTPDLKRVPVRPN